MKKEDERKSEDLIPYGLMIGAILGFVAHFNTGNFLWVPIGCVGGVLLSIIIGKIYTSIKNK